jgi:hypothetical protein
MTTPNPRGFLAYEFVPVGASRLQQKTIAELRSEVAAHSRAPKNEALDGKGIGGTDGVPADYPTSDATPKLQYQSVSAPGNSNVDGGKEEVFDYSDDLKYKKPVPGPPGPEPPAPELKGAGGSDTSVSTTKRHFPRNYSELGGDEHLPYYIGMYFSDI